MIKKIGLIGVGAIAAVTLLGFAANTVLLKLLPAVFSGDFTGMLDPALLLRCEDRHAFF